MQGNFHARLRELLKEIAMLMGYELTRDFPLGTARIETPIASCDAPVMEGKKCVIVPVLRAGLGMTDGLLMLMPSLVLVTSASTAMKTCSLSNTS